MFDKIFVGSMCLGFLAAVVFSLECIPERAEIHYVNPKYGRNASLNVRKIGKRGNYRYVVNMGAMVLDTFDKNASGSLILYEYLHNEYKRSFIEFHFVGCRSLYDDPYLGLTLRNRGFKCPVTPGYWSFKNMWIPNIEDFPYKWPFEKGKGTAIVYLTDNKEEVLLKASLYGSFKETKKRKPRI